MPVSSKSRLVQFQTAFVADKVDTVNAVIRGVSVITSGLIARGHDLEVDGVSLRQLHAAATARGQVPVKVDHKSGAAAVCGYLTNFHVVGNKVKADWHLLKTHPNTAQILEIAQRMPKGVGLSASFVSPKNAEPRKARIEELVSVDYVTLPAANPDGMFGANFSSAQKSMHEDNEDDATLAQFEDALEALVEQFAPDTPSRRESHTLESLANRLLLPVEATQALLNEGAFESFGEFQRDPSATSAFVLDASEISQVRRAVLRGIVLDLFDELGDEEEQNADELYSTVAEVLRKHRGQFEDDVGRPRKDRSKEFSQPFEGVVMLSRDEVEEPLILRAGKVAAAGGLAAGGLYLRGHYAQKKGVLPRKQGQFAPRTPLATMRQGGQLLAQDVRRAGSAAQSALNRLRNAVTR